MVGARDSKIQAIMPLRGKLISCFKNSLERISKNQEVMDIIKALGLDFDTKSLKLEYDESKLRYGRVVLAMDGK